MRELESELESEYEDSEAPMVPTDAGSFLEKEPYVPQSGETIPLNLDALMLDALRDFDADAFETKLYPVNNTPVVKDSKFFKGKSKFIGTKNNTEEKETELKQAKEDWRNDTLRGSDLVDLQTTDVIKTNKKQKKEFIQRLAFNIDDLREFLINEMAPTQLALKNAFEQSNQTIENILGVRVESTSKIVEAMLMDAAKLKVFDFIADKLKLSKEQKQIIINKYFVITVPTTVKKVESK